MKTRIQTRVTALLAAALFTTAFSASAQEAPENYVSYPYAFVTLQGGVQETATHTYNNWKLFTPTASASFGVHFTPIVGARLHVNGIWNKSGYKSDRLDIDDKYKYKYVTTDIDAMFNILNIIHKKNYRPVDLYLIGGVGLNYAWDTQNIASLRHHVSTNDTKDRFSHNFRLGGMVDVKVARNWSVNLEVDANSLSDRYNAKLNGSDDWQFTAQLGVTYKFGLRHKVKETPTPVIIEDPRTIGVGTETGSADTKVEIAKPEPVQEFVEVEKPVNIRRDIFFSICETKVTATEQAKLAEVAKWLKDHPDAKVIVTGYADKGTGTATINARYAKQRAESVTNELVKKYGIEASRITTESKGDTEQIFKINDQNRVTIVTAEAKETVKEAVKK